MAITLGTNAGFVTTAPTGAPTGDGSGGTDTSARCTKDTCPADKTVITEVGWYCVNATEAANYQMGLYSHDSGNDTADALLYTTGDQAKGTNSGWKTVSGLEWEVTPGTIYWIGMQLDNTATNTTIPWQLTGGRSGINVSEVSLPNPFNSAQDTAYIMSFYALVESGAVELSGTINGTSSVFGALSAGNVVSISGTINGVSSIVGAAGVGSSPEIILSPNWQTTNFENARRLVIAGNDSIYYEDI